MAHLIQYSAEYRWPDEPADEPEKISEDEHKYNVTPDTYDRAEGLTVVDLAHTLLKNAGIYEASSSSWNKRVWYITEPYTHPYTGVIEEHTYHLHGFTADESRELFKRITGKR